MAAKGRPRPAPSHWGSRQISELHVGGDFVDLHSFTLKRLDHSIMTLTPCLIVPVPHEKLKAITGR